MLEGFHLRDFGALHSEIAASVVDILSMEGKASVLGASVVRVLDQRLNDSSIELKHRFNTVSYLTKSLWNEKA